MKRFVSHILPYSVLVVCLLSLSVEEVARATPRGDRTSARSRGASEESTDSEDEITLTSKEKNAALEKARTKKGGPLSAVQEREVKKKALMKKKMRAREEREEAREEDDDDLPIHTAAVSALTPTANSIKVQVSAAPVQAEHPTYQVNTLGEHITRRRAELDQQRAADEARVREIQQRNRELHSAGSVRDPEEVQKLTAELTEIKKRRDKRAAEAAPLDAAQKLRTAISVRPEESVESQKNYHRQVNAAYFDYLDAKEKALQQRLDSARGGGYPIKDVSQKQADLKNLKDSVRAFGRELRSYPDGKTAAPTLKHDLDVARSYEAMAAQFSQTISDKEPIKRKAAVEYQSTVGGYIKHLQAHQAARDKLDRLEAQKKAGVAIDDRERVAAVKKVQETALQVHGAYSEVQDAHKRLSAAVDTKAPKGGGASASEGEAERERRAPPKKVNVARSEDRPQLTRKVGPAASRATAADTGDIRGGARSPQRVLVLRGVPSSPDGLSDDGRSNSGEPSGREIKNKNNNKAKGGKGGKGGKVRIGDVTATAGQNGKDGKGQDGSPGIPGPQGPPGSHTTTTTPRERTLPLNPGVTVNNFYPNPPAGQKPPQAGQSMAVERNVPAPPPRKPAGVVTPEKPDPNSIGKPEGKKDEKKKWSGPVTDNYVRRGDNFNVPKKGPVPHSDTGYREPLKHESNELGAKTNAILEKVQKRVQNQAAAAGSKPVVSKSTEQQKVQVLFDRRVVSSVAIANPVPKANEQLLLAAAKRLADATANLANAAIHNSRVRESFILESDGMDHQRFVIEGTQAEVDAKKREIIENHKELKIKKSPKELDEMDPKRIVKLLADGLSEANRKAHINSTLPCGQTYKGTIYFIFPPAPSASSAQTGSAKHEGNGARK